MTIRETWSLTSGSSRHDENKLAHQHKLQHKILRTKQSNKWAESPEIPWVDSESELVPVRNES